MENINIWLSRFDEKRLSFGECNCDECRNITTGRKTVEEFIKESKYFHRIPRVYDPNEQICRTRFKHKYMPMNESSRYWKYVVYNLHCTLENEKRKYDPAKHRVCADCGRAYSRGSGRIVSAGVIVCPGCWKKYYFKCILCNKIEEISLGNNYTFLSSFESEEWYEGKSSGRICDTCYNLKYTICDRCAMPMDKDHWVNISRIAECQNDTLLRRVMTPRGEIIDVKVPAIALCKRCVENYILVCPRCGEEKYSPNMEMGWWDGRNAMLCHACKDALRVIKRYDYSPTPRFLAAARERSREHGLHFGVELEMENPANIHGKAGLEEYGRHILDWWGNDDFYIKHDGSLETGFELVSHPFTWNHYLENKNKWSDFLSYIKDLGFNTNYKGHRTGEYTCGFHVHMSKNAFTTFHLYKFINFFYKKSMRSFIMGIAERKNNRYANFETSDFSQMPKMCKNKYNPSGVRYSVINMLGGHAHENGIAHEKCKTVEVRIFKGTVEPFLFNKNIEFLQSCFEFTLKTGIKNILVRKYIEYLLLEPTVWKCLLNYIEWNKKINNTYMYVNQLLKKGV